MTFLVNILTRRVIANEVKQSRGRLGIASASPRNDKWVTWDCFAIARNDGYTRNDGIKKRRTISGTAFFAIIRN